MDPYKTNNMSTCVKRYYNKNKKIRQGHYQFDQGCHEDGVPNDALKPHKIIIKETPAFGMKHHKPWHPQ